MKYKTVFNNDEENNITTATLKTSKGTFFGMSVKHPDDELPPSRIVGSSIAEARAHISKCNKFIANKKLELKGVNRLLNSMPSSKEGYKYAVNLAKAIEREIENLQDEKEYWKHSINSNIEGRKIYLKSRTTDRKAKEKYLKDLGDAIQTLGNINKDGSH